MKNEDPNDTTLGNELTWLQGYIDHQLSAYFEPGVESSLPNAPALETDISDLARLFVSEDLDPTHRVIIGLSLATEFKPEALDLFLTKNAMTERSFTEFGGDCDPQRSGFMPTAHTAAFLVGARSWSARMATYRILRPNSPFLERGLVDFRPSETKSWFSGNLRPSKRILTIIYG